MAAALLVVGNSRSTAVPLDDFRTRSRLFLRRGLVLSGALHLALLGAVLWVASRGDEGLVRITAGRIEVLPPAPPGVVVPPPSPGLPPPRVPTDDGIIEPVIPKIPFDFFDKVLPVGPTVDPGTARTGEISGRTDAGAPPETHEPRTFQSDQVDKLPVEIVAPKPRYPDYELEAGITGHVVMKVLVDEEGVVRTVERVSGSRRFGDAARDALYRWRFTPALVGGKPVRVWVEIPVNFIL